jgi:tetratricopeptide (TPR) repeat protein
MKLTANLPFLCLVTLLCTMAPFELIAQHVASQSAHITVDNIDASIEEHLDRINLLNHQYSREAQSQLTQIEQAATQHLLTDAEALRLTLLQCYNLLEHGEHDATLLKAKAGLAQARAYKLDAISPYFVLCEADVINYHGEMDKALALIDSAIELARRYQQPQALVNGLYLRAIIDTQNENLNSAMEDLRLALEVYPQAMAQSPSWQLVPKAYLHAAMGSLNYSNGDISQAIFYTDKARKDENAVGKIEYLAFTNSAYLSLRNNDEPLADKYINHVKKLIAKVAHPLDLALSYDALAVIDFTRDRLDSAETQIKASIAIYSEYQQMIKLAGSKRFLAKIFFKQGRDEEALEIIEQSIALTKNSVRNLDLQDIYTVLVNYYAEKKDFQKAYEYQVLRFELEKKNNAKINQARFLQFKARADGQHPLTDSATQPLKKPSQQYLSLRQTYGLVALGLVLLFISIIFFIKKEPKLAPLNRKLDEQEHEVNGILKSAKRAGYPLSILLLNISHIRQVDLGDLQTLLTHTLREQDTLKRHSLDEIIIFLPHASLEGARRVASQVKGSLENWQAGCKVEIGVASLQQLDSFEQLLKKAHLDQLSNLKRQQ